MNSFRVCRRNGDVEGAGDAWLDPNITDPAQAMTVALENGII